MTDERLEWRGNLVALAMAGVSHLSGHDIVAFLWVAMFVLDISGYGDRLQAWHERRDVADLENDMRNAGVVG